MKRGRLLASLGIAAAACAAACYIPLPHHVDCAFEIRPARAGSVYAGTPGQIVHTVKAGTQVKIGDELAVLKNPELEIRLVELEGEFREAEVQMRNLSLRSRSDKEIKAQLETQQELIVSIVHMKEKTQEEIDRLIVKAKREGVVMPPPDKQPQPGDDGRLTGWISPFPARQPA